MKRLFDESIFVIALLLLGSLTLLNGCREAVKEGDATIRYVKADTAKLYGYTAKVTFPGRVKASSDLNLSFRVSGPIARLHVAPGSFVKKGQLLAELDSRDYKMQLSATEAEYNSIKAEAERVIELYKKGSATPVMYDKALFGLKQITAKYEAHQNALSDTKLLAPSDGYIQRCLYQAGETIGAGMPVIAMVTKGMGEVEINIPAFDYIRRGEFDSFYCTLTSYPNRNFPLKLVGIAPKANLNELYQATFSFTKQTPEKELPGPGMTAMVTIIYKGAESNLVSIPLTALFRQHESSMVWVIDGESGKISSRRVKLSQILTNGTAVVSQGLSAGEVVLSAGVHSVKEGEMVRVIAEPAKSNVGGML